MMGGRTWMVIGGALMVAGCGSTSTPVPPPSAAVDMQAPPSADTPTIVFLGDSLTAGFGVEPEEAYPTLLQIKIDGAKLSYRVVNAGVSGDTTSGGLSRLDWVLKAKPAWLVVALGANDGLRGIPVEESRNNLEAIMTKAKSRGVKVFLVGMQLPVNYGATYRTAFAGIYPTLATRHGVPFLPFLLESVGGVATLNQVDGIHPNAAGHRRIADHVWQTLKPLLSVADRTGGRVS